MTLERETARGRAVHAARRSRVGGLTIYGLVVLGLVACFALTWWLLAP